MITSPVGTVQFAALRNMVRKNKGDKEPSVYTIRINFDGSTDAGKEYKEQLLSLGTPIPIPGTKNAMKKGDYTVNASTKFPPKIFAPDGSLLEGDEVPFFGQGSTATANTVVQVYEGKNGSGIRLAAVQFHTLDIMGAEERGQSTLDQLRSALSEAAK